VNTKIEKDTKIEKLKFKRTERHVDTRAENIQRYLYRYIRNRGIDIA
jgi:hypothetical protein